MRHVSVKQGLYRHVRSSIARVQISTIMKIILKKKKASGTSFLPKAEPERLFIATAVRKAWTGGLGLADATAVVTPIDLWLVKAKHGHFLGLRDGKNLKKKKKKVKAQWSVNAPVLVMLPVDVCLQTELLFTTREGGGPDTRTYRKSVFSTNFNMPCMTPDCSVHNYTMKRAQTTKKPRM